MAANPDSLPVWFAHLTEPFAGETWRGTPRTSRKTRTTHRRTTRQTAPGIRVGPACCSPRSCTLAWYATRTSVVPTALAGAGTKCRPKAWVLGPLALFSCWPYRAISGQYGRLAKRAGSKLDKGGIGDLYRLNRRQEVVCRTQNVRAKEVLIVVRRPRCGSIASPLPQSFGYGSRSR